MATCLVSIIASLSLEKWAWQVCSSPKILGKPLLYNIRRILMDHVTHSQKIYTTLIATEFLNCFLHRKMYSCSILKYWLAYTFWGDCWFKYFLQETHPPSCSRLYIWVIPNQKFDRSISELDETWYTKFHPRSSYCTCMASWWENRSSGSKLVTPFSS